MSEYFLFLLTSEGRVFTRWEFVCHSDDEAIIVASQVEAPNNVELWCGKNIIWSGKPHMKKAVD